MAGQLPKRFLGGAPRTKMMLTCMRTQQILSSCWARFSGHDGWPPRNCFEGLAHPPHSWIKTSHSLVSTVNQRTTGRNHRFRALCTYRLVVHADRDADGGDIQLRCCSVTGRRQLQHWAKTKINSRIHRRRHSFARRCEALAASENKPGAISFFLQSRLYQLTYEGAVSRCAHARSGAPPVGAR